MRFEARHHFVADRQVSARRERGALPLDLAFLEQYGVARDQLDRAAYRAAREGIDGRGALLAEGAVSESLYYRALARHVGLPFVSSWPRQRAPCEPRTALARGALRIAGGGAPWLVAPTGSGVRTLLAAKVLKLAMPDVALTAPSHLAAVICHRGAEGIAQRASRALPVLAPHLSALAALPRPIAALVCLGLAGVALGLWLGSHVETVAFGLVFLAALAFRLSAFAEGLPTDETAYDGERDAVADLPDAALPRYTIMVPLREEADSVAALVASLAALDYPAAKREVLFLVEPDDPSTRAALTARRLPPGFRIVDLPPGQPRTKPRALNVGLMLAGGDLVTVYDAEDRPEPDQLRRAAARFARAPAALACVQARLAITNGGAGLLPKLFALEYALLFDILNVGLGRLRLPLGLGGTSNHFRTAILRAVGGWDAWNVTEDADLGFRLARFGYDVAMLGSTTFEEAPERLPQWFKQRRRWTKGWMQTLIVLLRGLPDVARSLGPRRLIAGALLLTNLVTGPLLTPFFVCLVLWHLARDGLPAPRGTAALIETTLAVSVFVIGTAGTMLQGWCAARRRGVTGIGVLLAFLPYQLMIAVAACWGFVDLLRRPHHWHKTPHGAAARRVRRRASAAQRPA